MPHTVLMLSDRIIFYVTAGRRKQCAGGAYSIGSMAFNAQS